MIPYDFPMISYDFLWFPEDMLEHSFGFQKTCWHSAGPRRRFRAASCEVACPKTGPAPMGGSNLWQQLIPRTIKAVLSLWKFDSNWPAAWRGREEGRQRENYEGYLYHLFSRKPTCEAKFWRPCVCCKNSCSRRGTRGRTSLLWFQEGLQYGMVTKKHNRQMQQLANKQGTSKRGES